MIQQEKFNGKKTKFPLTNPHDYTTIEEMMAQVLQARRII